MIVDVLSRGFNSFEFLLNFSFILILCLIIYIFYWHSINRNIAKINRCKINLNSGGSIYNIYGIYDQTKLYNIKYDTANNNNITISCSCPTGNIPNSFKVKAYNAETDRTETINKHCICDKYYNTDDKNKFFYNGDSFLVDYYSNNKNRLIFPSV
jgi:hypothetical protein